MLSVVTLSLEMKFIGLLVTTLVLSACSESEFEVQQLNFTLKAESNSTFSKPHVFISGGSSARDQQFPFVAEIKISVPNGQLLCTGSVISSNWVVSARHCIAE